MGKHLRSSGVKSENACFAPIFDWLQPCRNITAAESIAARLNPNQVHSLQTMVFECMPSLHTICSQFANYGSLIGRHFVIRQIQSLQTVVSEWRHIPHGDNMFIVCKLWFPPDPFMPHRYTVCKLWIPIGRHFAMPYVHSLQTVNLV